MNLNTLADMTMASIAGFYPEAMIACMVLIVILVDVLYKKRSVGAMSAIVLAGLLMVLVCQLFAWNMQSLGIPSFSGMIVQDRFAFFFKLLFIAGGIFAVFFTEMQACNNAFRKNDGEYYALLLTSILGMFVMVSATNLLMLYVALELVSIPSYMLAGYLKDDRRSSEAALKYMLFGSISSAIMLFGISLLFGFTGSFDYAHFGVFNAKISTLGLVVIFAMILSGFAYKVAAFPFHAWSPDVYEGSPTPISAFFSIAPKAAGMGALIKLVSYFTDVRFAPLDFFALGAESDVTLVWVILLAIMSVLTMTYGNLAALKQTNMKRLLAFSSIAHAGYMMSALVLTSFVGIKAVMFYLAVYLFMNLGAFLIVILLADRLGSEDLKDWKGAGWKYPLTCTALALFLFSLTGLPPTAGFIGKFYIFSALIESNWLWLAVIGGLNSVIALYYYVKILKVVFIQKPSEGAQVAGSPITAYHGLVIAVLAIPTILLGIYWEPLTTLIDASFVTDGVRAFFMNR